MSKHPNEKTWQSNQRYEDKVKCDNFIEIVVVKVLLWCVIKQLTSNQQLQQASKVNDQNLGKYQLGFQLFVPILELLYVFALL